jgi:UDP-N-acetylglucosamine 2-epimerase (non-hydrolysing)
VLRYRKHLYDMKIVDLVIGARPNIMKIAPLYHAFKNTDAIRTRLIFTGQHSSPEMMSNFLEIFDLPVSEFQLNNPGSSQIEQLSKVVDFYRGIVVEERPDLCLVVGDVTSSLACSLVASKEQIKLAHVEAGLRSGDRSMPEELNRLAIDSLSDYLFTPSIDADINLIAENRNPNSIYMVGNVMIDSFKMVESQIDRSKIIDVLGLKSGDYGVVTFHRPVNVDNVENLQEILNQLIRTSKLLPLVFPLHPRTRGRIDQFELENLLATSNIVFTDPLDYLDFMHLVKNAKLVITDSGGVQEETTYIGVPCLTARENTERPITIDLGTNRLVSIDKLFQSVQETLSSPNKAHSIPQLWDGFASRRIVEHIERILENHEE